MQSNEMYQNLFNDQLQSAMENFFIEELAPLGRIEIFEKNRLIDPKNANNIYVVLEGCLNQVLYSDDGEEITYYRLDRGTIFGEMDYFENARTYMLTKVVSECKLSVVNREILDELLITRPRLYRYFLHSVTRKFRIVMLEMANIKFNDALGKIANALLRWHFITKYRNQKENKLTIDTIFTHEEIATRLIANRSTITQGLKFLKNEKIIMIDNKYITILDIERLKKYTKNVC